MTKMSPRNQLSSKTISKTILSTTILLILPNNTNTILESSPNSSLMTSTNSQETNEALSNNNLTLVEVWPLTSSTLWLLSKSWLPRISLEDKIMLTFLNSLSRDQTFNNLTTPTTPSVTNSKWSRRVFNKTCSKVLSLYSSLLKWTQVPHMKIWSRIKCSQCWTPTSNKPQNPLYKPSLMLFNPRNQLFNPHNLLFNPHSPKNFSS